MYASMPTEGLRDFHKLQIRLVNNMVWGGVVIARSIQADLNSCCVYRDLCTTPASIWHLTSDLTILSYLLFLD